MSEERNTSPISVRIKNENSTSNRSSRIKNRTLHICVRVESEYLGEAEGTEQKRCTRIEAKRNQFDNRITEFYNATRIVVWPIIVVNFYTHTTTALFSICWRNTIFQAKYFLNTSENN